MKTTCLTLPSAPRLHVPAGLGGGGALAVLAEACVPTSSAATAAMNPAKNRVLRDITLPPIDCPPGVMDPQRPHPVAARGPRQAVPAARRFQSRDDAVR